MLYISLFFKYSVQAVAVVIYRFRRVKFPSKDYSGDPSRGKNDVGSSALALAVLLFPPPLMAAYLQSATKTGTKKIQK